jgi:hypothetical protein
VTNFFIKKMTHWFSNKATATCISQTKTMGIVSQPPKKPHATNPEALFAKSHQDGLCTAAGLKLEQDGSPAPSANLVAYHDFKKKAYRALSDAEKTKWEALAKEHNDRVKAPPPKNYSYE